MFLIFVSAGYSPMVCGTDALSRDAQPTRLKSMTIVAKIVGFVTPPPNVTVQPRGSMRDARNRGLDALSFKAWMPGKRAGDPNRVLALRSSQKTPPWRMPPA